MKALGHKILIVGVMIMATAFIWFMGVTGKDSNSETIRCFYSNPFECQIAWAFLKGMGEATYNYLLLWLGVIVAALGGVVIMCDNGKEEDKK